MSLFFTIPKREKKKTNTVELHRSIKLNISVLKLKDKKIEIEEAANWEI